MSLNRPGGQGGAAWHESEAGNYRRQANLLLEQNTHPNSAGALLYEAAKQCINAVANQQGNDPGATRAKVRFLDVILERGLSTPDLIDNWQAAANLHINADRGHLTSTEFMSYWNMAQAFIDEMLLIYARSD